ncbi:MAG: hypothetical protein LBP65_03005 [Puniceicoccales bacterium]|jgi:hypothetical protein|nr:hypothetical protein [Puniceicoccales bacterium]
MNALPTYHSEKKEKIRLVPLETELANPVRMREVLNQLAAARGEVERLLRGGVDGAQFFALEAFRQAVVAATSVAKNFRP